MKIDGKKIAQTILSNLKGRVHTLKKQGTTPHLVIILVGNDPASEAYVRQKVKKAEEIGAKVTVTHFPATISQANLLSTIQQCNNNNNIHGLIVQQPLPPQIDIPKVTQVVDPKKDVDGFHQNTPHPMPLAAAVLRILEEVYNSKTGLVESTFHDWLKSQNIIIIGKGETGGGPVIKALKAMKVEPKIVDSKTVDPEDVTKFADIIISAVGKANIVKASQIKKGVVLISVGLHKGKDGKLHGDYEEADVEDTASFYTPTPGGVGPVNVAMLLQNLLDAAE